ncbi:uncharacterized protein lcorl isoform X2 [Salminus brasiliensis]|uniref:uncharacterized protein lcorl isoform X2 n=1 Tax=Salminus brasiliensis TaxID=930266 RepID=UPI003B830904
MATRCRSAKCAAERRGARRELETWRHKLIACVGFESILEGIYGPRLLQDLSIFDDCEPEATSDWSTDACCPFCSLQLEKLTDHVPVSPPPAETPPPQGLSTSERLQCQADQFLHAVFHKKEFPENCDPSIPLAAQELMRKMIRQFAIEYACKSHSEGPEDPSVNQADFPKQAELDGPLDLTVSRGAPCRDLAVSSVAQCPQQEGVLDLSKKSTSSLNVPSQQAVSGSLVPVDEDHCRMEEEREKPEDWRGTVLEKVLSSLCSYHRLLLYHMLQDMREDYGVAVALREGHRRMAKTEPYCCPAEQTSLSDPLPCTLSSCAAVCGFRKCAFSPTCIGMSAVSGLTCQNLAHGCVSKVVCPSSAICCAHRKNIVCQHQRSNEHACLSHAGSVLGVQISHARVLQSCGACQTCRSPSPPPLSPVLVDIECKMGNKNISCKGQEFLAQRKSPPLLPHRTEREGEGKALQSDARHAGASPSVLVKDMHSETEEDKRYCGTFFGGIMDEFTEKLKNIQPTERELTPQSADPGQHAELCDDAHLAEIITTVLHSSSEKEYDLKELFEQRMATERRSPQTRSRRRQEVLAALSLSPDLPASRRQSLQIKRDLARLDPSVCRRKLEMDKSKCPKNIKSCLTSTLSVKGLSGFSESVSEMEPIKQLSDSQRLTSETQNHQEEQEKQPADPTEIPLCNETDLQQTDLSHSKALTKFHPDGSKMFQTNDKVGRSRRNIVPPQRFSSYVTEPRKMYYAACFSEGVFVKHPPDVNATSEHDSTEMIHTAAKTDTKHLIKTEAQNRMRHHRSSHGMNTLTVLPQKIRVYEGNSGDDDASPTKRLRLCAVESLLKSQSPEVILGQSADTHSLKVSKELTYVSPIKLMLVSLVKGEDGVKYTLKAADSGSNPQGEMFDPCVEASWASSSKNEQTQDEDFVQSVEFLGSNMKPTQLISADQVDLINLTALPVVQEATPVKRRPGRPKKLGPQIEKLVKRPIGRPPKAKAGDPNSLNGTDVNQRTCEKISQDGSKNLKITILYGRSRKARRVVSEDLERLSTNPHYEVPSSSYETRKTNSSGGSEVKLVKGPLEDLHFVMPVEDRRGFIHASSNIKCQKQSDSAVTRKPGRPPKVKISGISVTVTTVSPRQRKIHLKKDIKESPLQHRALVMEFEPSKEQKTVSQHNNGVLNDTVGTMEEGSEPVRHSVRERKPSIHLLHSVATARSFSRSNALVCRSHKLLMCRAITENNHQTQHGPEVAANNAISKTTSHKVSHMKSVVRFSGVSVDSIFASDESFKWWSTTASPETLNKELARRIRLMSDTWVSEVLEAKKAEEVKMKQKPKVTGCVEKSSAVKMLFERNYSMEKLCSWFMQTTETQSLAIVKKASARNPYEVFHYSPIRPTCRKNVCPSPQAERLRKHVKKFAKVVPKSPTMLRQAQATVYKAGKSFAKSFLFNTSKVNLRHADTQKTPKSCGSWGVYRTALLRARSKFTINGKKTSTTKVDLKTHRGHLRTRVKTTGLSKELLPSVNKVQEAADISESKLLKIDASEQTAGITGIFKEERISSKAWSSETLKECRVFLKKINSPNATSVTEEYNFCTVKFNISPAGCDLPMKQEEQKSSETTKLQKTFCSPRKSHSSTEAEQSKSGAKRRSSRANESSPAKITRQLRSSRGVLAARWCDFVLGPSR